MVIAPGCLALLLLAAAVAAPFLFANLSLVALEKLGLSPTMALLAVVGIILGGAINIPISRVPREDVMEVDPLVMFGAGRLVFRRPRTAAYSVLAVNLGGCVIPTLLALYEIARLAAWDAWTLPRVAIATALNIAVCHRIARPVPGVGIAMPALVSPLVAASGALLLVPEAAPNAAFIAGVLAPLIGADLMHLREIGRISVGYASIGGAGTFDGIVISGLLAAFLA